MKSTLWIGVVAVLAAGFAAGAVWVSSSSSPDAELRQRLVQTESALETQTRKLESLQAEVANLRSGGAPERGYTAPELASSSEHRNEMPAIEGGAAQAARTPAEAPAPGAPTDQFQSWVRKVIADDKAEEEAKQKAAEEQRRVDRVNRRVDKAVETLALTGLQKDQFRKALLDEETGRAQLLEKFRNADPFGDGNEGQSMGDAFRENRRLRDEAMKTILSADQLEKWNAQDRRGGFFGGAGGPGGFGEGNRGNRAPNNRPTGQ